MGKTASARKGKDPHLRFRIAFGEVEALDEQRVSLHLSEILSFSFLFISFHFFFLKKRKKQGKKKKNNGRKRQTAFCFWLTDLETKTLTYLCHKRTRVAPLFTSKLS